MRRIFHEKSPAAWIYSLAIANSNSGFIGFAIASMVFPDIALPVLVRGIGLSLPKAMISTIQMLASVAPVIALFVVGGIVAHYSLSSHWRRTAAISFGKLIIHPTLVFAVLSLWPGLEQEFIMAAVPFAAVPMLSIYPMLGATLALLP